MEDDLEHQADIEDERDQSESIARELLAGSVACPQCCSTFAPVRLRHQLGRVLRHGIVVGAIDHSLRICGAFLADLRIFLLQLGLSLRQISQLGSVFGVGFVGQVLGEDAVVEVLILLTCSAKGLVLVVVKRFGRWFGEGQEVLGAGRVLVCRGRIGDVCWSVDDVAFAVEIVEGLTLAALELGDGLGVWLLGAAKVASNARE